MRRYMILLTGFTFSTAASYAQVQGGPYKIDPLDINGSGARSQSANYVISASTGQGSAIGTMAESPYQLQNGFWSAEAPASGNPGPPPKSWVTKRILADEVGTIQTLDESLTIDFDALDLFADTTIAIAQTVPADPEVDLTLGLNSGLGKTVQAVYDLEPDGLAFNNPVTLTIKADVTDLKAKQREKLSLYVFDDIAGTFVKVDTICDPIVEDPPETFIATCTAQVDHFSLYAMIAPRDSDDDGLPDLFPPEPDEASLGTDPFNPDTDGDGLLDGNEADLAFAAGSDCPDPVNADSDGDTLSDGDEVLTLGTDPCNADTDDDGVPDNFDPFPLDPEGTGGFLEDEIRNLAADIRTLDPGVFTGPNANANRGRRNALANRATAAANQVRRENFAEAINILNNLLSFVDGQEPPPDWVVEPQRSGIASRTALLITILEFLR